MTVENMTTRILRVYLWGRNVAHLVDTHAPRDPQDEPTRLRALCGVKPMWPAIWFGLGDDDDQEHAANMPTCTICESMRGNTGVIAA